VAHNGSLIPVPGRDIEVQAWYQGGVSVMDFTDAAHPVEIAYFDRGPLDPKVLILGGDWSAYWYNGHIYASEIARGLDIFELSPTAFLTQNEIDAAKTVRVAELNVQNQQKIEWPSQLIIAKAYLDQLERSQALPSDQIAAVRKAIQGAESSHLNRGELAKLQSFGPSLKESAAKTKSEADSNRLQSLAVRENFCVTLNANGHIANEKVLRRFVYHHPLYTLDALRAQKLFDAGVISKQEMDNAQTGYDAALSQVKSLDEQVKQQKVELHYYSVTSPMAGIVGDVPVRMGDRVTVATMVTTIDEPGALEAYIYVPGERAKNLRIGLPVRLLDTAGNAANETRITFVSPQVDTDTQSILAKATVENSQGKLRVAQQVRAQITWGVHEGPVIPVLAVQRINGQFFAFVSVNEGKGTVARQKSLKLGETLGNDFAVLDGLKAGDHIIVSGTQFLQDGAAVTEQIQKNSKGVAGQ